MHESGSVPRRDFSRLDGMSTEMLRDILRQDYLLPEEESDTEAILYISELLAMRDDPGASAVDAAWSSFQENYLGNSGSLYDDDSVEKDDGKPDAKGATAKPRRVSALRLLSVAVILILALMIGTVTSYARGYDLFGAIAAWTEETFHFRVPGIAQPPETMQYSDELSDLIGEFASRNMPFSQIPRYIPDGYKALETECYEGIGVTEFFCILSKGEGGAEDSNIILQYSLIEDPAFTWDVEKDDSPPEIYESHGTEYYIVTNMGKYIALWNSGDLECGIFGVETHEDMIKMLASMDY